MRKAVAGTFNCGFRMKIFSEKHDEPLALGLRSWRIGETDSQLTGFVREGL
jgi:hypothetical protein